jgi:osmotically-inducible protein OsmY
MLASIITNYQRGLIVKKSRLLIVLPTLFLAVAFAQRAVAQSATESFHKAGESTENAGDSAGHAVVHAYHGTKTATEDTAITTKVKASLLSDATTKSSTIHVKTVAGVVTLRGQVASSAISDRAQQIAETTSGVERVRNKLRVSDTSAATSD